MVQAPGQLRERSRQETQMGLRRPTLSRSGLVSIHSPLHGAVACGTNSLQMQVAYGEPGNVMLKGEWESAKKIHKLVPGCIPRPIGFGPYDSPDPISSFYLSEFVEMDTTTEPDPEDLAAMVAEMHDKCSSPTGKFGFHVVTCDGKLPHTVGWEHSWAVFGKLLRGVSKLDIETNGP